jgi:hypothetical protein
VHSVLDGMRHRIVKSAICAMVSVVVAIVVSTLAEVVENPRMMSHPIGLWDSAVGVAALYVVMPVIVLVLVTILRGVPSIGVSIGVAICWLTVIFVWWVHKPLAYYGVFPWSGFRRHYLEMLSVPISFGFAFGLCAWRLIGPKKEIRVIAGLMPQSGR